MDNKKITKKENYEILKGIVLEANVENADELVAFLDKQIVSLDNRAAKAKEKAAEKKAEGDELRAVVKAVLTDDFQTADDIAAQIEGDDVTKAKVVARLSQLVKIDIFITNYFIKINILRCFYGY